MTTRTAPFNGNFFYHAMVDLLGREPDIMDISGHSFRYEPRDRAEDIKFGQEVSTLREWLSLFELTPLSSRCEYGCLPHPQKGEEGKYYLDIRIVHPVEKN